MKDNKCIPVFYKLAVGEDYDWITKEIPVENESEWNNMCKKLALLGKPYPTLEDYLLFTEEI